MAVRGCVWNSLPPLPCHFQVRGGSLPTSDWHEPHAETKTLGEQIEEMRTVAWFREQTDVPFVNRPFESEIHGTVNFTQFCCVLLVTWCYRVLLSCYLRPK